MAIHYKCFCGCLNTREQMVPIYRQKFKAQKLSCIKHQESDKSRIQFRLNTCSVCGELFQVRLSGMPKYTCDKCKTKKTTRREITIDCKQILIDKNITPIPGEVINFYDCGCIVPNKYDENKVAYFPESQVRSRSCPFHSTPQILIGKYKVCGMCGSSHTGWGVQSSINCQFCPTALKKSTKEYYKFRNKKMRDPEKSDCEYRDICTNKFIDYDAVPCKGCEKYKKKDFTIDPYASRYESTYK
jgi:hypothetical protein